MHIIIRTAEIQTSTSDVDRARPTIDGALQRSHGYISAPNSGRRLHATPGFWTQRCAFLLTRWMTFSGVA